MKIIVEIELNVPASEAASTFHVPSFDVRLRTDKLDLVKEWCDNSNVYVPPFVHQRIGNARLLSVVTTCGHIRRLLKNLKNRTQL